MRPRTGDFSGGYERRDRRVAAKRWHMAFTVISNSFKDRNYLGGDLILSADFGFGCAGGNKPPHLKWSDAPAGTKSFAVICYDADAPTGSGFWHWLVVNIPANVGELAAGAGSAGGKLPAGALQTRGFNLHFNTLAKAEIMGLFKR
jgi:phosphatidylethanolamine-binding protein (PEBP) family uncharacterized protein